MRDGHSWYVVFVGVPDRCVPSFLCWFRAVGIYGVYGERGCGITGWKNRMAWWQTARSALQRRDLKVPT